MSDLRRRARLLFLETRDGLRGSFVQLFTERRYEVLPREWIAVALLLTVGAGWWGWSIGGQDFLVNILASLTLLGPGLLLTNVVAARWRADREWGARSGEAFELLLGIDGWVRGYVLPAFRAVLEAKGADGIPNDEWRHASAVDLEWFRDSLNTVRQFSILLHASMRQGAEGPSPVVACQLLREVEYVHDMIDLSVAQLAVFGRHGMAEFSGRRLKAAIDNLGVRLAVASPSTEIPVSAVAADMTGIGTAVIHFMQDVLHAVETERPE